MCIGRYSRSRDAAKESWTGANLGKGVYPRLWQTKDITTSQLVLRTDLLRCQVFGLEQINAQLHREIPQLRADNQQLKGQIARLRRDSSHSSKPPSGDIVGRRTTRHAGGNANARSVVRRAIPGINEPLRSRRHWPNHSLWVVPRTGAMPVPFGRVVGATTSRARRQALHRYRTSRPKVSRSANRAYRDRSAAGRRQGRRPGRPEALRLWQPIKKALATYRTP
jgi:hypothetical protein